MTISLYDASVSCYLQILPAVRGFLDKGMAYCRDNNLDPAECVETRVFPDMRPFRFQIQQVVFHSLGAIETIKNGVLQFPQHRPEHDYAGLQALVTDACDRLAEITPEEVNVHSGADIVFQVGPEKRIFTAEGFVLSFSLPNFHFHATTAYDILRMKGVPLGKLDYVGTPRLKA